MSLSIPQVSTIAGNGNYNIGQNSVYPTALTKISQNDSYVSQKSKKNSMRKIEVILGLITAAADIGILYCLLRGKKIW